ncbi:hypothetical protein CEXT_305251 [Caerostris extrusa]|uniref:Uncharacterized protein n=1 Tax=Caerostris extrusa TaxID=172846 RepID=A0AAV4XB41_CAEEX|nr:hypothetical protein CEXT_305251 [Caerostris extrusa]
MIVFILVESLILDEGLPQTDENTTVSKNSHRYSYGSENGWLKNWRWVTNGTRTMSMMMMPMIKSLSSEGEVQEIGLIRKLLAPPQLEAYLANYCVGKSKRLTDADGRKQSF